MAEFPAEPNIAMEKLWVDVRNNLEESKNVIWRHAVSSLKFGYKYFLTHPPARAFVQDCMHQICSILLDQHFNRTGLEERGCIQESILFAVSIVAADLKFQVEHKQECKLLSTLELILDRSKIYYKGIKGTWHVGSPGSPEVRMNAIEEFRNLKGFDHLADYLTFTTSLTQTRFIAPSLSSNDMNESTAAAANAAVDAPVVAIPPPSLVLLRHVVIALSDGMKLLPSDPRNFPYDVSRQRSEQAQVSQADAISFGQAVMRYIYSASDDTLKRFSTDQITELQSELRMVFDTFVSTPNSRQHRPVTMMFYQSWRDFCWRLISSGSLPLKLFGWEQLADILEACAAHRPPPRYYICSGAGSTICDGRYDFHGSVTDDGYVVPKEGISYVHIVPPSVYAEEMLKVESLERDAYASPLSRAKPTKVPKKLTIFRCTMRSRHKWWFLSEADEQQPGTDKDVDYYQHKSNETEESQPPSTGWITCRNAGADPPPFLQACGLMVPPGEEYNTLEHQLAKWAIKNEIVEQVLGDTTIHREVVARSTVLIKFLASMCDRYLTVPPDVAPPVEIYCLLSSHLLFAWKTCLRKADAAVSTQVYQLLVSVLPLCPVDLANPLLQAVQQSLQEDEDDERNHLFEVSEFCSALASGILDAKADDVVFMKDEVRREVLNLLWSVLTHPAASSLRSYETMKRYVTHELRVEPNGREHRDNLIRTCYKALSESASTMKIGGIDEVQVLRMVELTKFMLDACPREQAVTIVSNGNGELPLLLLRELTAFLKRKRAAGFSYSKSLPATHLVEDEFKMPMHALRERLRVVRHVYGLCDPSSPLQQPLSLEVDVVKDLWELCDAPDDREALMVFIAQASRSGKVSQYFSVSTSGSQGINSAEPVLYAAFTREVASAVFLDLFCSSTLMDPEYLSDAAYKSFQDLLASTKIVPSRHDDFPVLNAVIEALWRISLVVADDNVAALAMKDLLNMHVATASPETSSSWNVSFNNRFDDFRDRVIKCFTMVEREINLSSRTAKRTTERCLRIVNASIGQSGFDDVSVCSSTLTRLQGLAFNATLDDVSRIIPHGMRGQGSYRRVGIKANQAKCTLSQNQLEADQTARPSNVKFALDLHPLETLESVKIKIATHCQCPISFVKPIQVDGRAARQIGFDSSQTYSSNLNMMPEDTSVDEIGIVDGCELVVVIVEPRQLSSVSSTPTLATRGDKWHDLSDVFFEHNGEFSDRLFGVLMNVLKLMSWKDTTNGETEALQSVDTHQLVWEFLLAAPTNSVICAQVKSAAASGDALASIGTDTIPDENNGVAWSYLLDFADFDRSVYVLLTIDALLRPAGESISILRPPQREQFMLGMESEAAEFRASFIKAGGFQHVTRFFSAAGAADKSRRGKTRRGNAVALRILKSCLFGDAATLDGLHEDSLDNNGRQLLETLVDAQGLLTSLLAMVVDDAGISSSVIADVIRFLMLVFQSSSSSASVEALSGKMWEAFIIKSLTHEVVSDNACSSSIMNAAMRVRRSARDLILQTTQLADNAVPWLTKAVANIDVGSECSEECFDVLGKLISGGDFSGNRLLSSNEDDFANLAAVVCRKLVECPRPRSESEALEVSTSVLCGCLKLLRALVERGRAHALASGVACLLAACSVPGWYNRAEADADEHYINLMGVMFDAFLSPVGTSSVAVCCDKESRRLGFDIVEAAARACSGDEGYNRLMLHINSLIAVAAPKLKHRWGQYGASSHELNIRTRCASKYSGLKNAGCTCYMNSVLQQLFMMSDIRESLCSVPLPSALRTSGDALPKGFELVGKTISLHWETGASYEAMVEAFDESTGTHCIRYCPIKRALADPKVDDDVAKLPRNLFEEFVLSEGRTGKETGVYQIVVESTEMEAETCADQTILAANDELVETDDERASRRLLEEVQRTFIHLDEGARGRHFDPKALVEACTCLKLEFDVWQQNDASEFTTKLLDRLEVSLRKWAPAHFRYLDHMFGIKQIKQKICRECGLKSNREEKLLNIDCQIRGKTDIQEALATFTETEIMEGSNQVFCESCDKNTDTILRTALSTLPNVLILSLKRFDLDFTTFETVKLNSRCAFGQTLNMKQFTLEGIEAKEKEVAAADNVLDTSDTEKQRSESNENDEMSSDVKDYEYRLAGVLVHAGVAQGGHYYSFIRERNEGADDKWYRFDDEDVTPFDPANIETECFGGRVKKETKWPNGQVHTVEQEQFANALMLFYEKVEPLKVPADALERSQNVDCIRSSGYDVFKDDVLQSNAAHRWQAFLFDSEFQLFLKRLLGHCAVPSPRGVSPQVWREPLLLMLLEYFFDVMPYSVDRGCVHDWVNTLEQALYIDARSARRFVHILAKKTSQISSNWYRTFLVECPDQAARSGAVRVFGAGIRSCLSFNDEQRELAAWVDAWSQQSQSLQLNGPIPIPAILTERWAAHEDIETLERGGSSSVGILISSLNVFLDVLPRCWRMNSELFLLIRQLAVMQIEQVSILRKSLIAALIPMRLLGIILRDRLQPIDLQDAFPGACVSLETANSQTRPESGHGHSISMTGNHMNSNDSGRGPNIDYLVLFECLSCIASLPGAVKAILVVDSGELIRGRRRYILTDAAVQALTAVFHEHCPQGSSGMARRDLEAYLSQCGAETVHTINQRVSDMMKRSAIDDTAHGPKYLTLTGFLAYYRDVVQNDDSQLRTDLHFLGFRPDLSRRSFVSRKLLRDGRTSYREPAESIAIDVGEFFCDSSASLGVMADLVMGYTLWLYDLAFRVSEVHALYLLAAVTYQRDISDLLNRILQSISTNAADWPGNERVSIMTQALKCVAAVQDRNQNRNIFIIMESQWRPGSADNEVGLLPMLRNVKRALGSNPYSQELQWIRSRYIAILRNLLKSACILQWMQLNKSNWAFVERDLTDDRVITHQVRDDFMGRDDIGTYGPRQIGDRSISQTDVDMGNMNEESEDDDDDEEESRFGDQLLNDDLMTNDDQDSTMYLEPDQSRIEIQGAGSDEVNGVYREMRYHDGHGRFSRRGIYDGKKVMFWICLCNVSNNTRHWYISIVPHNKSPGTSNDIDFYHAPCDAASPEIPPRSGWVAATTGKLPAPYLNYLDGPSPVEDDDESFGNYDSTGLSDDINSSLA
ncbi:hypothetical protein MPSEU_000313600 [Mayamaea pseudoterrestris]|nr:hypothetical protein MPSEU_000313600 [Mayamaea pseudoterrestris]